MFIPLWLVFLGSGLLMAVFAVLWGIRSRQFEDQDRARYLPLVGLTADELSDKPVPRHRAEYMAICTMLVVGIAALGAGFLLALRFM